MEVKQAYVTKKNFEEIFSIIEEALISQPNTQVFVDRKLYNQMCAKLYSPNVLDDEFFYGEDIRKWFEYFNNENKVSYLTSFVSSTREYVQLVSFQSKKVRDYTHYFKGFKSLLLILVKPKK